MESMGRHRFDRTRVGGSRRSWRAHQVTAAIDAAVASCGAGVGRPAPHLVAPLVAGAVVDGPGGPASDPAAGADGGARLVDRALARALVEAVAGAWRIGWQPADVHRAVARQRGRTHARLVARAIACDAAGHGPADLPPRWRLQLDAIGAGAGDTPGADSRATGAWVRVARSGGGTDRTSAVVVAVEALATLRRLPRMPKLGPAPGDPAPPPGRGRAAVAGEGVGADPRVLHRVTALLAKAESTTFPDEAEALTAKAQALMTRHAIDRATVDARAGRAPGAAVGGRRLGLDDPYAGARYLLLSVVADANRCRAVWSKYWGFATVFGDEGDLDAVELLYTSLLVQATRAMVAEGPTRRSGPGRGAGGAGAGGGGRTRSFRQSFLVAFGRRIGARLHEAAAAATAAEAGRGTALVPLFAARRRAADEAVAAAYPDVGTTRMSANDAAGWHAGTAAASRAQLDLHGALRR
jgi:hypothetical protein